jgi:hypothetical protein
MKFNVSTTGYSYSDEEQVELYRSMGFEFGEPEERGMLPCKYWHIKTDSIEMEINSLVELLKLQSKVGCELIISGGSIEIYDNYRE